MSQTFAMSDRKLRAEGEKPVFRQRVFHGAHSWGKMEIKGQWHTQGPQPVSESGGVPQCVVDIFDKYPHVQQVAIAFKGEEGQENGSVFSRIDHEVREG